MTRMIVSAVCTVVLLVGIGCSSNKGDGPIVTISSPRWLQSNTKPDAIPQKFKIGTREFEAHAVESHTLAIGDVWFSAVVPLKNFPEGNYEIEPIGVANKVSLAYSSAEDGRTVEMETNAGVWYLCQDSTTLGFKFAMERESKDGPLTLVAVNTNCTNTGQTNLLPN